MPSVPAIKITCLRLVGARCTPCPRSLLLTQRACPLSTLGAERRFPMWTFRGNMANKVRRRLGHDRNSDGPGASRTSRMVKSLNWIYFTHLETCSARCSNRGPVIRDIHSAERGAPRFPCHANGWSLMHPSNLECLGHAQSIGPRTVSLVPSSRKYARIRQENGDSVTEGLPVA